MEFLIKSDMKVRLSKGKLPFIFKLDVGIKWK
jgi:hypothetical protein